MGLISFDINQLYPTPFKVTSQALGHYGCYSSTAAVPLKEIDIWITSISSELSY